MSSLTNPAKKISRQFESLLHYKRNGFAYPLTAEIDLTWRCALNCKGCHSKWLHKDQELEPDQIKHILHQLKRYGCNSVTWSGGGDPMESPHWQMAMEYGAHLGLKQGIYTYFPSPSQERVNFIDSYCEFAYTHPFNTRGFTRKGRGCTWTAGFLMDKDNWQNVPKMIGTVNLAFFDYVDFRPLSPINAPDAPMLDYGWIPQAMECFKEYENNPKVKWASYKFRDLMKPNGGRDYGSCYSTDFVAAIGPNGDVWECINRRGFSDSVLGNILSEDLADIWARKSHRRDDFAGCRVLCRNHEMNKELFQILGPAPNHEAFV